MIHDNGYYSTFMRMKDYERSGKRITSHLVPLWEVPRYGPGSLAHLRAVLEASWLRTRRFSEPTFRPSGTTSHWKKIGNRDFPTFSHISICFFLTFSLLLFYSSTLLLFSLLICLFSLPRPCCAFHLSILSEV